MSTAEFIVVLSLLGIIVGWLAGGAVGQVRDMRERRRDLEERLNAAEQRRRDLHRLDEALNTLRRMRRGR